MQEGVSECEHKAGFEVAEDLVGDGGCLPDDQEGAEVDKHGYQARQHYESQYEWGVFIGVDVLFGQKSVHKRPCHKQNG